MDAYGPSIANGTLVVPAAGIVVLALTYVFPLENYPNLERKAVQVGVTLAIAGTLFAALYGHIIWLVPIVLLPLAPFLIATVLWDLYTARRDSQSEKPRTCPRDESS